MNPMGWRTSLVLIVFLVIAAFFLITEHRAHLFGVLPYLLLLACPLMHWLMHGGHGGHGEEHRRYAAATPAFFPRLGRAARRKAA